jgi:membrane protein implicated in regulation of membrane protease activity
MPNRPVDGNVEPMAAPPSDWIAAWLLLGAFVGLLCVVVATRSARRVRRLDAGIAPLPPLGGRAVALTEVAAAGIVRLGGEEWSAAADPSLPPAAVAASGQAGGLGGGQAVTNRLSRGLAIVIRAGEPVEVVAQEGLRLRVRRLAIPALPPKEA